MNARKTARWNRSTRAMSSGVTARPWGMRSCRRPVVAVSVVAIVVECTAVRVVFVRIKIAARLREVVAPQECRGDNCQRKYPIHVWVVHSWGLTHYEPSSQSRDAPVSMGNHATRTHPSNSGDREPARAGGG